MKKGKEIEKLEDKYFDYGGAFKRSQGLRLPPAITEKINEIIEAVNNLADETQKED